MSLNTHDTGSCRRMFVPGCGVWLRVRPPQSPLTLCLDTHTVVDLTITTLLQTPFTRHEFSSSERVSTESVKVYIRSGLSLPDFLQIHITRHEICSTDEFSLWIQTLELYLGSTFGPYFGNGYRNTCFGSRYRSNRRWGNRRFFLKKIFFVKSYGNQNAGWWGSRWTTGGSSRNRHLFDTIWRCWNSRGTGSRTC